MAKIVFENWQSAMSGLFGLDHAKVDIAFPFIKIGSIQKLFPDGRRVPDRLITRLSFADMVAGVHDLSALVYLAERGTKIRALKNLHAKSIIVRGRACLIGSANLTASALGKNHECGAILDDPNFVHASETWFENLWSRAGRTWTVRRLKTLLDELEQLKVSRSPETSDHGLPDYGQDGGQPDDAGAPDEPSAITFSSSATKFTEDAPQFIVKMFGTNRDRSPATTPIVEDLRRGTTHYAYSYPTNRRPKIVQDGAVMFASRLARDWNGRKETWVFGRAIGSAYREGRDDATPAEIASKPWRKDWSHYVRVHSTEFINGRMGDGVPLLAFLERHGPIALQTTKERMQGGEQGINPKLSLRNQAQVRLSVEGFRLLNEELEARFRTHGIVPAAEMARLDWPVWAMNGGA